MQAVSRPRYSQSFLKGHLVLPTLDLELVGCNLSFGNPPSPLTSYVLSRVEVSAGTAFPSFQVIT